jgi:hypothetical protein
MTKEADQAKAAFTEKKCDLLSDEGREVWTRMHDSALRVIGNEDYATAMAWRAIGQKYELLDSAEHGKAVLDDPAISIPRPAIGFIIERGTFTRRVKTRIGDDGVLVLGIDHEGTPHATEVIVPRSMMEPAALPAWVGAHREEIAKALAAAGHREKTWTHQSKFFLNPAQAKERIVYGEAYVPWEVDLQREYATEAEVLRMAHGFMLKRGKVGEMHGRWKMPDGQNPGEIVESFVARRGDPHFTAGAWCVGVKAHPSIWERVLSNQYRGFSIGGRWATRPISLQVSLMR